MRSISIQLNKITGVHSAVRNASECLVLLTPLLKKDMLLHADLIASLLAVKPILVAKTASGYEVVAGFREWKLAKKHLAESDKISVRVMPKSKRKELLKLAWTDVLGIALSCSLNPKKLALQLADVSKEIPPEFKVGIFSGLSNKQQLSKATQISRSSFYPAKEELEPEEFSFEATFQTK